MGKRLTAALCAVNIILLMIILIDPAIPSRKEDNAVSGKKSEQTSVSTGSSMGAAEYSSFTEATSATRAAGSSSFEVIAGADTNTSVTSDLPPSSTEERVFDESHLSFEVITEVDTNTTVLPPSSAEKKVYDESNVGRPTLEDFEWYWRFEDIPRNAVILEKPEDISGRWKAMNYFVNKADMSDKGMKGLLNVDIRAGDGSAEVVYDWYMMCYDNSEWEDETAMDDIISNTSVSQGSLRGANQYGTVSIDRFWQNGDIQYGLGSLSLDNGNFAYLILVRE